MSLAFLSLLLALTDFSWPQFGGSQRDFKVPSAQPPKAIGARLWRQLLGPGTSGVVTNGQVLVTQYSQPNPKDKGKGEEAVVCLNAKTGERVWEHRYAVQRLPGQESFSGDPIRPQATPALSESKVCTLGYTGLLKCLDLASGRVLWEWDLVKDFGAMPVQFGFAGSPLAWQDLFIVPVGGKQAALIAFRVRDGRPAWKSAPAEPSYASPIMLADGEQVVHLNRDELAAYSARDGVRVWSLPAPKAGLTNVPTPLPLSTRRLLVSGQGWLGTRLLQLADGGRAPAELWKNDKVQFFYSNWLLDGETVYGVVGDFLGGLDLANGKELWRERGQKDGNLLLVGSAVLVLRGDGRLSLGQLSPAGFQIADAKQILEGRCWTAPTVTGDLLFARSEQEIVAHRLVFDQSPAERAVKE